MKNIVIENDENQMILRINKKGFDENYLISLFKRLQVEELAQKSDFDLKILGVAEQINEDWWKSNGEEFLKAIQK